MSRYANTIPKEVQEVYDELQKADYLVKGIPDYKVFDLLVNVQTHECTSCQREAVYCSYHYESREDELEKRIEEIQNEMKIIANDIVTKNVELQKLREAVYREKRILTSV